MCPHSPKADKYPIDHSIATKKAGTFSLSIVSGLYPFFIKKYTNNASETSTAPIFFLRNDLSECVFLRSW